MINSGGGEGSVSLTGWGILKGEWTVGLEGWDGARLWTAL